ncbi:hypothetical protein F7725_007031 [Dissostichus mawsoni]|uniref:Rho-GAP domain-containing protein n=1 Tax=Dissostichus mawsoni TaxID=36200 RepID=A0A7J5XXD3_DISMA|nr:hypothetical protein F7725_007031 [Dissostichus mawsoni]
MQAAGFPQYVQLFKDCRFPIDIEWAKRDHHFLDRDALDSLCRRLNTLNKCVEMRLEPRRSKRRITMTKKTSVPSAPTGPMTGGRDDGDASTQNVSLCDPSDLQDVCSIHSSSSTESEGHHKSHRDTTTTTTASIRITDDQETSRSSSRCSSSNKTLSLDPSYSGTSSPGGSGRGSSTMSLEAEGCFPDKPPRKKGSSLLRKMEKLRMRGPTGLLSLAHSGGGPGGERMKRLNSPRASSSPSSPHTISSNSSNSQSESSSTVSTPSPVTRVRSNCKRSNSGVEGGTTRNNQNHPGTEEPDQQQKQQQPPESGLPGPPRTQTRDFPTSLAHKHTILSTIIDSNSVNWRTGSFHGCRGRNSCHLGTSSLATSDQDTSSSSPCEAFRSPLAELDHRLSIYDNVSELLAGEDVFSALDSILERIGDLQQLVSTWSESLSEDDCQRGSSSSSRQLWSSEQSLASSPGVESQSVSQFLLLQKLSLLKLTALMDKYSPCSKQGWNWTVPKQQRKTKPMGVKGRRVFGVPLLSSVQQTGEPLPPSILRALVYLRTECLDQVGLFRKSGVKSRIQYLRELVESDPLGVLYDGQSAFDVADMVKQYFRDLPEPIFTSKLCESFLQIYQYFPKDQQLVAAQAAILLLPDENRVALRTLLFFLRDVVACVEENQMTPTNIAVCLAPSLFHLNTLKRDANARSSPRKYSLGRPDQRDLISSRVLRAPPRTRSLRKEKGWWPSVRVEMDDGCPLWMWRGSVEVDAPQKELLQRLLREQQLWEGSLRQASVIQTLSKDAEVYRYLLHGPGLGLGSWPPQEHLLLRPFLRPSVPLLCFHGAPRGADGGGQGPRPLLPLPAGAKGRSQEWHCKVSGHLVASGLLAIRDSFRAEHKETNI